MLLVSSIIVIALNKDARTFIRNKTTTRFFLPLIFLLGAFFANIYVDVYFYKEIIKALLPSIVLPQAKYLGEVSNNILPNFYTFKIFYLYGLLGFFIVGASSIISSFHKKEFYKLVPFFIVIPTCVYFLDSQITPDHPWLLRRFMFSLLPVAIFYTGLLIGRWLEKKPHEKNVQLHKISAVLIIMILLAMNLPSFLKYVTYIENKGLLAETRTLSSKFSPNDLILIDQQASGDGWSMLAGPMNFLYGKNAVYFFNNQDLAKLNTSSFSNIYLISPSEKVPLYLNSTIGSKLTETYNYSLSTTRLDIEQANTLDETVLPEKQEISVTGKIFLIKK
jgi:hypothetical protein